MRERSRRHSLIESTPVRPVTFRTYVPGNLSVHLAVVAIRLKHVTELTNRSNECTNSGRVSLIEKSSFGAATVP